jgi:hypothetical protein
VLFGLSTKYVDNFVDNCPLTAGNPIFHAGFYKLLKRKAENLCFQIKELQSARHETKCLITGKVVALHNFISVNKSFEFSGQKLVCIKFLPLLNGLSGYL